MKQIKITLMLLFIIIPTLNAGAITPLPLSVEINTEKAALGKKLFSDPILSKDNTISCASCHLLEQGGDDNRGFSLGIYGQVGTINAPTVYNAAYNFRQFWDGRAKDLAEQAMSPIENPIEMGNSFENLIKTLQKSPYKKSFEALYKDGITKANITDAITEFEIALITPNAPFDNYLRGDTNAITPEQKEGYALFKSKGCIACHHGMGVGGNLYNKFGVLKNTKSTDLGRFNVTKRERDKFYFKVPSLRNVAQTAPYFHDARTDRLEEAVKIMALHQLGRQLSEDDIYKIVAFLHALSGKIPNIAKP